MIHPDDFDACRTLINDIQALETRAHRLKAHTTGHALNSAKNTIGWELARAVEREQKVSP